MGSHFETVVDKILEGRVVPFLGAGVNLCDRPRKDDKAKPGFPHGKANRDPSFRWSPAQNQYLPSGSELAEYLADEFRFQADLRRQLATCAAGHAGHDKGDFHTVEGKPCAVVTYTTRPALDLARVSEFGGLDRGPGDLNETLHNLFAKDYPGTTVHRALTSLPMPAPRAQRACDKYPLIATTNYDDCMERAFPALQEFDLVFYDPEDEPRGRFWHRAPGTDPSAIKEPNDYTYPFCEHRPVILKLHGSVGRDNRDHEGFVITEDHYIEYLAEEALEKLLPITLLDKLRNDHLLFLGYSLKDWNFRVFLRRLKKERRTRRNSWAIMLEADETDEKFWTENKVEIKEMALDTYMTELLGKLAFR